MTERKSGNLKHLPTLALQQRRQGLARQLPSVAETLRGSLLERYMTCGKADCKCTRGQRHGPLWYLSVTLGPGHTTGGLVNVEQLARVRRWIANYQQVKEHLEKISEINRELLRRERQTAKK